MQIQLVHAFVDDEALEGPDDYIVNEEGHEPDDELGGHEEAPL